MSGLATPHLKVAEPPRRWRRVPVSLWIFVAWLALFGIGRALLSTWNRWTLERFLNDARDADISRCRSMLAEDRSRDGGTPVFLDLGALRAATEEPDRITSERLSAVDYIRGRGRYFVHLMAFNDHSIMVEWGRVTVGSSFWLYYPPGPEFRLTRQVETIEEYKLRQQEGEAVPKIED